MIDIQEYIPEHARYILAHGINEGAPETTYQFGSHADHVGVKDQSFTLKINGEAVACGGILPMWHGVGEGWVLASHKIHGHTISIPRIIYDILDELMDKHGYWRIQGATLANWKQGLRFARFLGFEKEGLMKRYGPGGEDYVRHARVKDGT